MYPPIDVFEDVADPADWETDRRCRSQDQPARARRNRRHPTGAAGAARGRARRQLGDGAVCHLSRDRPSRFSDGSYGVYYAGDRFEVALAEAVFHFERFIAATGTGVGWLRSPSRYGNGSRAKRGLSAESDRDYR